MEIYFNFYFYDLCYDIHGLHKSLGTCRAVGQNFFMFWDSVLNRCAGARFFVGTELYRLEIQFLIFSILKSLRGNRLLKVINCPKSAIAQLKSVQSRYCAVPSTVL